MRGRRFITGRWSMRGNVRLADGRGGAVSVASHVSKCGCRYH